MKEMILLFHLPDKPTRRKVEMALFPLKARVKYITLADYNQPLGVLAGNSEIAPAAGNYAGEELSETLFVFSAFSSARLYQVIAALRKSGAWPFPYKAILTPTNQYWTAPQCLDEIKKEHEAVKAMQKKDGDIS